MTTIRNHSCSCCGSEAGKWVQWHNRDTGFGICASCVSWLRSRNTSEAEIRDLYGVEGIHFATPPTFVIRGPRFTFPPLYWADGLGWVEFERASLFDGKTRWSRQAHEEGWWDALPASHFPDMAKLDKFIFDKVEQLRSTGRGDSLIGLSARENLKRLMAMDLDGRRAAAREAIAEGVR